MHSQEEDAKHGTRFCRLKEGLVSRQCRRLGMALRQYLAWQSTGFRRCGWRILRIWGIWGIWGMNDSCRLQLQAGTVYSTRLSFLLPSKLTCSEVRCTDNLLPTCCVCHGTQSCRDRNQCYKAILLRPGATSDCKNFAAHLPIQTVARRQQTRCCRLCSPAALVSPISQSRLRTWERHNLQGKEPGEAGSRGEGPQVRRPKSPVTSSGPAKASVPSRSAPLFCGSHTGWPLDGSRVQGR